MRATVAKFRQSTGAEPLDVLQEHRLPLAVGADDGVVIGHRQLDDRVEARERPVAREHLLDRHPRMARCRRRGPAGRPGSSPRTGAAAWRIAGELVASMRVERRRAAPEILGEDVVGFGSFIRSIPSRAGSALRKRTSRRRRQHGPGDEPRGRLAEVERGLGAVARPSPARRPAAAWWRGRRGSRVVHGARGHRRVDQAGDEQVEPDPVGARTAPRRPGSAPGPPPCSRRRRSVPKNSGDGDSARTDPMFRTVPRRPESSSGCREHLPHGRAVGQERPGR